MVVNRNPFARGWEHYPGEPTGYGYPNQVPGAWIPPERDANLSGWGDVLADFSKLWEGSSDASGSAKSTALLPAKQNVTKAGTGVLLPSPSPALSWRDDIPKRPEKLKEIGIPSSRVDETPWVVGKGQGVDNFGIPRYDEVAATKRRLKILGYVFTDAYTGVVSEQMSTALKKIQETATYLRPTGNLDFYTYWLINQEAYKVSRNGHSRFAATDVPGLPSSPQAPPVAATTGKPAEVTADRLNRDRIGPLSIPGAASGNLSRDTQVVVPDVKQAVRGSANTMLILAVAAAFLMMNN